MVNIFKSIGCDWVTGNGSGKLWFAHPTLCKTVINGCIIADIEGLKKGKLGKKNPQVNTILLKVNGKTIKTQSQPTTQHNLLGFNMSLTIEGTCRRAIL